MDDVTAQILKRLDFHSERLSGFDRDRENIASIAKSFEREILKVEKTYKYLFGNGEPGLDEQMRGVIEYINEDKETKEQKKKEERDDRRHYLRLTVGTALTSIVILIINGIVYFVKILPVLEKLQP